MNRSGPLTWLLTAIAIGVMAIGAVAGTVVWWLLKGMWFVFAVAPYRVVANLRYNSKARKLERAAGRLAEYVNG